MTDRPILFSAPMVRALLEGRKTQTRRALCLEDEDFDPPYVGGFEVMGARAVWRDPQDCTVRAFPGAAGSTVGDRLYVREPARVVAIRGGLVTVQYDAGGPAPAEDGEWPERLAAPVVGRALAYGCHREASRITLTVTDVRVQRVQDISEEDAAAEGIVHEHPNGDEKYNVWPVPGTGAYAISACDAYRQLWDDLNAKRGFGWEENPWVVALTFTVEHRNIDQAAP